jgi:hypothetical protein
MSAQVVDLETLPKIEVEKIRESKLPTIDFDNLPFGKLSQII